MCQLMRHGSFQVLIKKKLIFHCGKSFQSQLNQVSHFRFGLQVNSTLVFPGKNQVGVGLTRLWVQDLNFDQVQFTDYSGQFRSVVFGQISQQANKLKGKWDLSNTTLKSTTYKSTSTNTHFYLVDNSINPTQPNRYLNKRPIRSTI
jgi:hypothetical protein